MLGNGRHGSGSKDATGFGICCILLMRMTFESNSCVPSDWSMALL
jgi:hypothetical protein